MALDEYIRFSLSHMLSMNLQMTCDASLPRIPFEPQSLEPSHVTMLMILKRLFLDFSLIRKLVIRGPWGIIFISDFKKNWDSGELHNNVHTMLTAIITMILIMRHINATFRHAIKFPRTKPTNSPIIVDKLTVATNIPRTDGSLISAIYDNAGDFIYPDPYPSSILAKNTLFNVVAS